MAHEFDVQARNTVIFQAVGWGFVGALPGAIWIFVAGDQRNDFMRPIPMYSMLMGIGVGMVCGAIAASTAMLAPSFRKRLRTSHNEGRSEFVAMPIHTPDPTKKPKDAGEPVAANS
jgi:apolipoprotein N-acyltransferase